MGMSSDDSGTPTADPNAAPATRLVNQPTKFGKLLKVALPIIQGGAIGGFGGDWKVPGSGERVAEDYFDRQAAQALQKKSLDRNLQNDQFKNLLEYARANHEMQLPAAPGAAGRTWQAQGPDGKTHIWGLDPYHPQAPPIDRGVAPDTSRMQIIPGTDGYAGVKTSGPDAGKATPITTPGNQPSDPVLVSSGGLPIMPPSSDTEADRRNKAKQPQPEKVTKRDASGAAQDYFVDKNPQSATFGQRIGGDAPVATRAPAPIRKSTTTPDKGKVETYAGAILDQFGGDGDKAVTAVDGMQTLPPEMKSAVRQRIREMKRPGQPKAKKNFLSPEDQARLSQVH